MDPFSWGGLAALASAASGIASAVGTYQAGQYKAHQAEEDAKIGQIRAKQIDSQYRDELSSTIANIRTIRAATGVGANSPTTLALEGQSRTVSDRNRTRDVANQRIQSNRDAEDAKFLRRSAGLSLGVGIGGALLKLRE
jgi:hypothetical protein